MTKRRRLHGVLWSLPAWLAACGGGDSPEATTGPAACTGAEVCVSTVAGGEGTQLWFPYAVVADAQGGVQVADYGNHQVPLSVDSSGQLAAASTAPAFPYPPHIATAGDGTRYMADTYGTRIVKVSTDGATTVVAGTGRPGADDGIGRGASFRVPHGVALDAQGNLYVADSGNARIRKITFPSAAR
jgi:hypothetical protein